MIGLIAALALQAAGASAPQDRPVTVQPDVEGRDVVVAPVPPRSPPAIVQPPKELGPARPGMNRPYKGGLWGEDYIYTLAPGVTFKEVAYWSEGVPCYAKIFYPKGFNPNNKIPAVVLGQGWAGTHYSIEKYGARFAEKGLVAMVIDYRGWGASEGTPRMISPIRVGGSSQRDMERSKVVTNATVEIIRTRLSAHEQQEDYRNAISYIQGEPGVDAERIGVWGSSYAGGNAMAVAGMDSRVKAVSVQIPAMQGSAEFTASAPGPAAIARARTGRGPETATGYSRVVAVDVDQGPPNFQRAWATRITRPAQIVAAEKEELNPSAAQLQQLLDVIKPKAATNLVVVPEIGHFEMYINTYVDGAGRKANSNAFEISSNAAADWFVKHLNAPEAVARAPGGPRPPAPPAAPAR